MWRGRTVRELVQGGNNGAAAAAAAASCYPQRCSRDGKRSVSNLRLDHRPLVLTTVRPKPREKAPPPWSDFTTMIVANKGAALCEGSRVAWMRVTRRCRA